MMTMNEMKTNDTMKKTKDTTDDARECAPLVPADLTRQGTCASTRPTESQAPQQNKNPPHGPMASAKQTPATSPYAET